MESPVKFNLSGKDLVILAGLGVGAFIVYKIYKMVDSYKTDPQTFANDHPNIASFLISVGVKTNSGQIPDVTGSTGAAVEQSAFNAVVNDHSQGFYNAALQQFAYDNGFDVSLSAQGTAGWSWGSYAEWTQANYPTLPTAGAVTVDSHGVYHNDYT